MGDIMIYFANAFITLFFYFQSYFWYIVLFILFAICVIVEFKEKSFLYIDDERKVV